LLSVLELCRQGKIRTQQTDLFGDIVIERRTDTPSEPEGAVAPLGQTSDSEGVAATERSVETPSA
jgi:hypothetical protein